MKREGADCIWSLSFITILGKVWACGLKRQESRNDGTDRQSGDNFEKSHADAPPRANAQKDPYKMGLTGLQVSVVRLNLLTPNVNYSGRTAPLTPKVAIYIFIQQI